MIQYVSYCHFKSQIALRDLNSSCSFSSISSHPDKKRAVHHVEITYIIYYVIHPGYTIRMPSTKRLGFNSNSHTENGYQNTFGDFEYIHVIIIKTIYYLKNKVPIAFF